MEPATSFQLPASYQTQTSVNLKGDQEPPFELKTNFRGVFGVVGTLAGIAAGITAGVFLGMVVTPFIAVPVLGLAAAALGFGGGVVGYTAGEKTDITIAERKISTQDPKNPALALTFNVCLMETVHEAQQELPKLASAVVNGIADTAWEMGEKASDIYQKHLKGKTLDEVCDQYVLQISPKKINTN